MTNTEIQNPDLENASLLTAAQVGHASLSEVAVNISDKAEENAERLAVTQAVHSLVDVAMIKLSDGGPWHTDTSFAERRTPAIGNEVLLYDDQSHRFTRLRAGADGNIDGNLLEIHDASPWVSEVKPEYQAKPSRSEVSADYLINLSDGMRVLPDNWGSNNPQPVVGQPDARRVAFGTHQLTELESLNSLISRSIPVQPELLDAFNGFAAIEGNGGYYEFSFQTQARQQAKSRFDELLTDARSKEAARAEQNL